MMIRMVASCVSLRSRPHDYCELRTRPSSVRSQDACCSVHRASMPVRQAAVEHPHSEQSAAATDALHLEPLPYSQHRVGPALLMLCPLRMSQFGSELAPLQLFSCHAHTVLSYRPRAAS